MEATRQNPEWPPEHCDSVQVWLNARADGECTPAQEGWLAEHLDHCRDCSQEWAALERTRLALETARLREPSDFEREALARALAPQALHLAGWLLLAAGALLLALFGAWSLLSDDSMPLLLRVGLTAVGSGLLLLLARVGWERFRVSRLDPYRGVQR